MAFSSHVLLTASHPFSSLFFFLIHIFPAVKTYDAAPVFPLLFPLDIFLYHVGEQSQPFSLLVVFLIIFLDYLLQGIGEITIFAT